MRTHIKLRSVVEIGRKKSLRITVPIALAMALVLPGTVGATHAFRYEVLRSECVPAAGDPISGYMYLKVKAREIGESGANQFRVRTKVHFLYPGNTRWTLHDDRGWQYSQWFPNDADNWYHVRAQSSAYWYDYPWRIKMRVQVLSDDTGVLSESTFSQVCQGN